jgi:outer membrane receptor protein involved in Fe transport
MKRVLLPFAVRMFSKIAVLENAISRAALKLISVGCVLLLFSTWTFGQTETGQITGTISDATGAVLLGAKVVAKSVNTGLAREATTNSAGIYTIPSLKPGVYEVTVTASGFQSITQRVQLTVGANSEVSVQLAVGSATETIEVISSAGNAVNTESQTLSETITSQQIEMLPTSPTRNPYALVGTSGNVSEDPNSNRGAGFSINGMRSASTDILLDGAENVSTFDAKIGQTVPLDSVQEFSVLTNNFTAEYGRASGGVVNLVTKSGTNTFHGSAYEYNRVAALSANTFQNNANGTPKGGFTRNDFGFSIGGPVIKNKLFFFNNTEWIRVRSSAPINYNIIDPGSIPSLGASSQAFFAAYGKLSPGVRTIASGPCAPGSSLTCDTVSFNAPADAGGGNPGNTTMEVARIDYNFSANTTLFGRYASYKELDFPGVVNSSPYAGYNTGQTNYDQNYEIGLTHFFTPSLVNTAKAVFNRLNGPVQPLGTAPISPTLYINSAASAISVAGGSPANLIFPGYSETTPGNSIPFGGPQNLYQFYDDVSWTVGRHQFKFGGQFVQLRDNRVFGAYQNPVELLGTSVSKGLANLISGNIYSFAGAVYPQGKFPCPKDATGTTIVSPACTLTLPVSAPAFNRNYRYNDGALYAQDSWKVIPRFTLNLGVRWEYYGVQHNANQALDSNFVMGTGATFFDQIRNGSVQLAQDGGVFWKPKYGNFGPRVGFAWDVFGDGKTSLRGGYAISYERNFGNVTFNAIQNPPNYAVISLISAAANSGKGGDVPSMPVYTDPAGPLAGTGTKALPAVSQRAINQNIKSAYATTWNLSVDRRVGKGLVSVAYAGSNGVHLYDIANINPVSAGGTYLGDAHFANRLNYQYSNMNFRSDNGLSHYNALNVRYGVTNFLNKGLGLTANYTWSHALDNLSSTFSDGVPGSYQLGYLDAFNPRLNYGNADFDIRHRFSLSATWEIPWLKTSNNAFARNVLGGWGIGTIFSIRSGSPFSIYDCGNFNGTSCPLYAPGVAIPRTGSSTSAGQNLFNYIALPPPTPADVLNNYIVGNGQNSLGIPTCTGLNHVGCTYTADGTPYPMRNQFFGPGFWNLDTNFYKSFKLTERFGLQLRGEFYNIFNHHNQYITGQNLDVSSLSTAFIQTEKGGIYGNAGQPTDERRNIQFGLRLTF